MSTPVIEIVNLLVERRISSVPIIDEDGNQNKIFKILFNF